MRGRVAATLTAVALAAVAAGALAYVRAGSQPTEHAAPPPRPVTVIEARAATFQPQRRYVGTVQPWIQAAVGPQFIAAYADTVLVRPGALVKRGQVLATLDCRDAAATEKAITMQARAIEAKQKALANESARVNSLLDGGYVAPNEAEQKAANSESELAQLMATQAKLAGSSLAVNDCVLRAPFDGEVADRMVDPGAFVHPGDPVVSVVDRSTVRVTAEVPEDDFSYVGPGTSVDVRMLATGDQTSGVVSRRSPAADLGTRTVHFEVDLSDPKRRYAVGTTAELRIAVGSPRPATVVAAAAASQHNDKFVLLTIDEDRVAKAVLPTLGDQGGMLYFDPAKLHPGTLVVSEGASLLKGGDRVVPKRATAAAAASTPVAGVNRP